MKHPLSTATLVLTATTILAGNQSLALQVPSSQPNILIILLDDAGYNDFGFKGSKDIQTPNIDGLARDGVILTDAHTSGTVSGPSRCGLLTGRYQQRGGYECNPASTYPAYGMNLNERSIGNVFQDAGYKTICIGKWHQGRHAQFHPNKRGFDEFYGFLGGARSYFYNETGCDAASNDDQYIQHNGTKVGFDKYLSYELGDKAVEYIKNRNDQPFMMYLAYNAVHGPYEATPEDLALFEGHPRQMLAAMSYAVDKSIGQVVDALKSTGQYENTLIFVLSDNGGVQANGVSNYPLRVYKGNKFEGGNRVTFFVSYAGTLPAGTHFDGLSSALDILPTAAAAAHIDLSKSPLATDGVNLLPYLAGQEKDDPHEALCWRRDKMAAIRVGDYKFIRARQGVKYLYNIEENITEDDNLIDKQPERAKKMAAMLENWEQGLTYPLIWHEDPWPPNKNKK